MSTNLNETEDSPQASPKRGGSRIVLWLIVLSLGILFLPLFLLSTALKENNLTLETQLATLEVSLTATPEPNPTEQALTDQLLQLRQDTKALETLSDELGTRHINWPGTIAIIGSYDQEQITLTGLTQTDNLITLSGQADNETAIMTYVESLRASEQFTSVVVQAISLKMLPTATPIPSTDATADHLDFTTTDGPSVAEFMLVLGLKQGMSQ